MAQYKLAHIDMKGILAWESEAPDVCIGDIFGFKFCDIMSFPLSFRIIHCLIGGSCKFIIFTVSDALMAGSFKTEPETAYAGTQVKKCHLLHYTSLPCINPDMKFSYYHGAHIHQHPNHTVQCSGSR